jgi:outer membrane protein assembly factor BamB
LIAQRRGASTAAAVDGGVWGERLNEYPESIGPYAVLGLLGEGGMGRVYLAESPGSRMVAVKVIRPEYADSRRFRESFRREAAAVQRVNGAFTAPVLAAGPDGEPPWLATLYTPAPSLAGFVSAYGPLHEGAVRALGAGLAEALSSIHAAGILHRDLKPGNVLVTVDGPRVIDFGISRETGGADAWPGAAYPTGGTPGFMPPEQITGQRPVSEAADVFALGAVLVYALTGRGPFDGSREGTAIAARTVHAEPDLGAVPETLRPIITACLHKDPALRPTPAEVLAALSPIDPRALMLPDLVAESERRAAWAAERSGADADVRRWRTAPPPTAGPTGGLPADAHGFGEPFVIAGSGRAAGLSRRRVLGVAAASVAASGGLGALGWRLLRGAEATRPPARAAAAAAPPLQLTAAWASQTPVSGNCFAFIGDSVLWMSEDYGTTVALAADTGTVRWSQDILSRATSAANPLAKSGDYLWKWYGVFGSTPTLYCSVTTSRTADHDLLLGFDSLGDQVSSSPIGARVTDATMCGAVGDAVALFYDDKYQTDQYVATDLRTGSVLWSRSARLVTRYQYGSQSVADAAYYTYAITDDTRVYLHDDTTTYALDPRSGTVLWQAPNTMVSGVTPGLALCGETLVVAGNKLVGLHRDTGMPLWTTLDLFERGPGHESAVAPEQTYLSVPAVSGDHIVVFDNKNSVYAVNAASGARLWTYTGQTLAPANVVPGQGSFTSDQVVVANVSRHTESDSPDTTDTSIGALRVTVLDAATGATVPRALAPSSAAGDGWDHQDTTATMAVNGDHVYVGLDSYVYAFQVRR